jgi:2-oxoglutarate ferredoxin oxidoreductase subunit alpha
VALNPAALQANIKVLMKGGVLVVNQDAFTERNLEKAGYTANPLEDGSLSGYQIFEVPMTSMTLRATEHVGLTKKEAERCKNMFALGLLSWMYSRPTDVTVHWIEQRFSGKPELLDANVSAFKAGYNFGETTELFAHNHRCGRHRPSPARTATSPGATALAWGLIAASVRSGLPIFYASYPITPASELLPRAVQAQELRRVDAPGRGRDRCGRDGAGAPFAGQLGVTGTSGLG